MGQVCVDYPMVGYDFPFLCLDFRVMGSRTAKQVFKLFDFIYPEIWRL